MEKDYGYAWEKFYLAVCGLVTSTEGLTERLRSAYIFHFMPMHDGDIPPRMKEEFDRLGEALFNIDRSPRDPSDKEVSGLLKSIVSMYGRVGKYGPYDETLTEGDDEAEDEDLDDRA